MLLKIRYKTILTTILLIFVAASISFAIFKETKPLSEGQLNPQNSQYVGTQIVAYYFHGSARCSSCYKIEKYTTETLNTKFSSELKSKKILFHIINVEEKMNNHFINDYLLNTKSVVLSEINNGKEIKWKNLEKVWELLGDQALFSSYIETEVRSFLRETKP